MKQLNVALDLIALSPERLAMEKMLRHLPEIVVLILVLVLVVAVIVRKVRK